MERPSIRVLFPLLWVFSSSSGLYKIIKSSYLTLEKAQCKILIYLGDMLLMSSSLWDLLMARDTLIFIFQHLGFLINFKKFYLEATLTLKFIWVIVDSRELTLSLPEKKLLKVQNHCQEILRKGESNSQGTKQTNWEVVIRSPPLS